MNLELKEIYTYQFDVYCLFFRELNFMLKPTVYNDCDVFYYIYSILSILQQKHNLKVDFVFYTYRYIIYE